VASKPNPAKQTAAIIKRLEKKHNCDIVLYCGGIYPNGLGKMLNGARRHHPRPKVMLILTTPGGLPNCAFRIMRCLQNRHSQVTVFVPHVCMSAGTLMAIGADEIVLSDNAQLGPLDVQVRKPDELGERASGLIPSQAFVTLREETFSHFEDHFLKLRTRSLFQLTTKTCAEIAARITIGCMGQIFRQFDPIRLGELQRAMMIAIHYGERLAKSNLKDGALEELVAGYPDHSFVIDRTEAGKLFKRVRAPSRDEMDLAAALGPQIAAGMNGNAEEAVVEFVSASPISKSPKGHSRGSKSHASKSAETPTSPATRGRKSRESRAKAEPASGADIGREAEVNGAVVAKPVRPRTRVRAGI
jgi:hypothetical protein